MWTQWRKVKICNYLMKYQDYAEMFSWLINAVNSNDMSTINDMVGRVFNLQNVRDLSPDELSSKYKTLITVLKQCTQRLYNRLEFNQHLNNKKALYINMKNYYKLDSTLNVFDTLPITFHIKEGESDT